MNNSSTLQKLSFFSAGSALFGAGLALFGDLSQGMLWYVGGVLIVAAFITSGLAAVYALAQRQDGLHAFRARVDRICAIDFVQHIVDYFVDSAEANGPEEAGPAFRPLPVPGTLEWKQEYGDLEP